MFRKQSCETCLKRPSEIETDEQIIANMERLKSMLSGDGSKVAIERAIDSMARRLERRSDLRE